MSYEPDPDPDGGDLTKCDYCSDPANEFHDSHGQACDFHLADLLTECCRDNSESCDEHDGHCDEDHADE